MNLMARPKKLFSSIKRSVRGRTETTAGVYRTSGNLFYRFAIIPGIPLLIKLPFILLAFVMSLASPGGSSPPGGGPAGVWLAFFLMATGFEIALFIPAILLGKYLLRKAATFYDENPATKESLWHCGYLLLGLAVLLLAPVVCPVLFGLLGILLTGRPIALAFGGVFYFYPLVNALAFGPRLHPAVSFGLGGLYFCVLSLFGSYVLWVARDFLKRSKGANSLTARLASVIIIPAQGLSQATGIGIEKWITTDTRAYQVCGVMSYLFAAVLVLPVAWFQVSRVVLWNGMTPFVDIWITGGREADSQAVIPMLLTVVALLVMAAVAVVRGRKHFAQARESSEPPGLDPQVRTQCGRFLKRMAWLLLVILPVITAILPSLAIFSYSARYWKPDHLFATVNDSLREAKSTFLWLQLYPLLTLGIVAAVLAIVLLANRQGQETEV